MALLLALHVAQASLGIGLSVVHVHHGLRGADADTDLAFVDELCERLDLLLYTRYVSVPDHIQASGQSTEEAARTLRYGVFDSLLQEGRADSILTAHTLNDQAETVIMKLLRGAWTEGLSAICPNLTRNPGKILRPLLAVHRSEIEAYLTEHKQPWREDATNAETIYTRNRVRHHLMPLLREFNPGIDQALGNLATLAQDDEAHWKRAVDQLLPQLLLAGKPVRGGGRSVSTLPGQTTIAVELERVRALDPATRRRVVRAAARQMGVRLNFNDTERLLSLCESHQAPTSLQLPDGLRAQRSIRELRLSRQALGASS